MQKVGKLSMFDSTIPAYLLRYRVYLLHFITPYKHAKHYYLGCADDLSHRLDEHRCGTGARLTQVVKEAGISWVVARTWRGGRRLEKRLKSRKNAPRELCPICRGEITLEEVLAEQPAPVGRVIGRRIPMGAARSVMNVVPPPVPVLDCAWCLKEAGIEPGDGSHGICPRHAEQLLADWRARLV